MGPVSVKMPTQEELVEGEPVEFGKGDLVTFPEGTGCTWKVEEPIGKQYRLG